MTEKELHKLNRYQLLELLIMQTQEVETLREQLANLTEQQQQQELRIADLGSVAEASLQLSGVFEAAQDAADRYVEAARKQAEDIVAQATRQAEEMLRRAENKLECDTILNEHLKQ